MSCFPSGRKRQRGVALIALAAALLLGVTTIIVVRVNELSARSVADHRSRNGAVLELAKKTLIGYVAMKAAQSGENNPGRLPCPESPNDIGGTDEGTAASNCDPSYPVNKNIGRLPWRTLGLEKLLDAKAEPLWYVVSPGWAYAASPLSINSNTTNGQLTVDGAASSTTIALIIAPDVAMQVQASAGCTARNQTRSAPSTTIDARDYVECLDITTGTYATTGPGISYNDQVVRITVADVMPAIEAAIAARIEREIVPALKAVYPPASWGYAGTSPVYPFPAGPFADPSASAMQGSAAATEGLLPLVYAETSPLSGTACTPGPSAPRCNPSFVAWTAAAMSGASIYSPSCTTTATTIDCTYHYQCLLLGCTPGGVAFTLTATASNVGMAMRQLNPNVTMTNVDTAGRSASATLNAAGSAAVTVNGNAQFDGSGSFLANLLCNILPPLDLLWGCKQQTISIPVLLLADHSLLDSNTTGTGATGWFVRNRWHELTYYAVAPGYTPAAVAAPSCTSGTSCVSVANLTPSGAQRAVLILGGRGINASPRPSGTLADYLEFGNATAAFERWPVSTASTPTLKTPFNDRFIVVDQN